MTDRRTGLELWGGPECTVNRVGDGYIDQLELNGHATRADDLELFAGLGLQAIRYPCLWERIAPNGIARADWSFPDQRLPRLRALGLKAIVGLVHHGSGPRYTDLLDPELPEKLAEYAGAFAARYPWIEDYTPINEPLTTARFSCLYGAWYPHLKQDREFCKALINQCRATALCMSEIRKHNPRARLIQTDDLGRASSRRALSYQADFENERRWLGWDLLFGTVQPGHALWSFLRSTGIDERELRALSDHPCPPDLIGINHYQHSNRHLDERLERHPPRSHGGNGRDRYADLPACEVRGAPCASPEDIYREAWERYRLPLAITEVHVRGPREEQLRWFMRAWEACEKLRSEGVDLRAITSWGLLGHFDWDTLATERNGRYESGAFDVRSPSPRPTAISAMIQALARTGELRHPILQRDRPILITGAPGALARGFALACERRGLRCELTDRRALDIADGPQVSSAFTRFRPWAVINCAGYNRAEDAEAERDRCHRDNVTGVERLVSACEAAGARLLTFSSDRVFDGAEAGPWLEDEPAKPLSVYGRSKAAADDAALSRAACALVLRTGQLFSSHANSFFNRSLQQLRAGAAVRAASDLTRSLTYLPDLVEVSLDLLIDAETGLWHMSNPGGASEHALLVAACGFAGLDPGLVIAERREDLPQALPRPRSAVLASRRGSLLPPLESALHRCCQLMKEGA